MEIADNLNLEESRKNFLNSLIGKAMNNAFDIGLRALLPDMIENQIIDIKNSLLESGIKAGVNTAIDTIKDFKDGVKGLFSGKFENINQINFAVGDGGIIDIVSNLTEKALFKIYDKGKINKNTFLIIKSGKDVLLDNLSNSIKKELNEQNSTLEKLEKSINNWQEYYKNQDFEKMEEEYNKIEKEYKNIIPVENVIEETRKVRAIQNLIKNNEGKFDISEEELKLAINFEK